MLSAPPASTRSLTPVCTCMAALSTACRPEPQRRSSWQPGHLDRQPGVERRDPADRRRLAVRVALAEDDVVDRARLDAGPGQQRADDGGGQLGRGHVAEDAAVAAHRGAQRLADHDVAQGSGHTALHGSGGSYPR